MLSLKIKKIQSSQDLELAYLVMKELRQDLSYSDFLEIYEKAHAESGYEILALEQDQAIVALVGFRVLHDFVHGKHLYIDDLVSTKEKRSQGFGAKLLLHAEEIAKNLNCRGLRLCTGIENEAGKKFYENNKWNLRAIVYKKKLSENK